MSKDSTFENAKDFMSNLTHRKAKITDLPRITELLLEDALGTTRESNTAILNENYIKAFHKIDSDPNQYLMVVDNGNEIIFEEDAMTKNIIHFAEEYKVDEIGQQAVDKIPLDRKQFVQEVLHSYFGT